MFSYDLLIARDGRDKQGRESERGERWKGDKQVKVGWQREVRIQRTIN